MNNTNDDERRRKMFILYDLVEKKSGPTSEQPACLSGYDWNGHDPAFCAVLPSMGGRRVSRADAQAERCYRLSDVRDRRFYSRERVAGVERYSLNDAGAALAQSGGFQIDSDAYGCDYVVGIAS